MYIILASIISAGPKGKLSWKFEHNWFCIGGVRVKQTIKNKQTNTHTGWMTSYCFIEEGYLDIEYKEDSLFPVLWLIFWKGHANEIECLQGLHWITEVNNDNWFPSRAYKKLW